MSDPFLVRLFEHKAWCNRGLAASLRAAPADVDRLTWSIILLTFEHTWRVDEAFRARLSGAEQTVTAIVGDRRPDLEALAGQMAATDAWYQAYAARVTPDELAEVVEFTFLDGDPGRMTKGEMLAHVITHGASHRGAIGKMLEGLNLSGASDMVTTFARQAPI
jgi:uncharacterized damage-inducible protein DinB